MTTSNCCVSGTRCFQFSGAYSGYCVRDIINDNGIKVTQLKIGKECKSKDKWLGKKGSMQECAKACEDDSGCKFFIYGTGSKRGKCYREYVSSTRVAQQKGWEKDSYDFYELK